MPRGDRTGPEGKGSKTGRGLGLCNGNKEAGYLNNSDRQRARRGARDGSGRGQGQKR